MAKNKVWIIILFAVLIYLSMGIYADYKKLISVIKDFRWIFLSELLFLTTAGYFVRFIKWLYFLRKAGIYLNMRENLFVFFSGLSMIITPGKIGEIWKGWLIKDINGEKLSKSVPVVIVDRITDVSGLVMLAMLGIIYFEQGIYLLLMLIFLIIGFVAAIKSKNISAKIISILEKKIGKYAEDFKTMHETLMKLMEPSGIIRMSFISAIAWFFECLGLYLVIKGFGQYINLTQSAFIFSFASLAGAISMVPGGLGVAEATISGLLQFFGISPTISVAISMVVRFGTLWYGAILGLCVYFVFRRDYNAISITKELK
ncbi:hypothetical protein METP1_03132 [Methanosarcinales archaeon]|nr:hypothetical protein METP1_03132 [Methanosarcinales archaeon]